MKTKIRFFIVVTFGLLVGFGVGLYTGSHLRDAKTQTSLAVLQQPAESPELHTARTRLNEVRVVYTDPNPLVKDQRERIRVLEARNHAK